MARAKVRSPLSRAPSTRSWRVDSQLFRDAAVVRSRVLQLAAASVAVLFVQTPPPASASEWVRLTAPNEFYVAWMPEQPEPTNSSYRSVVGRTTSIGYELDRDEYGCWINSTQLPGAVRWLGGNRWVYSSARDNLMSRAGAKESSYDDWERSGVAGKALEWNGPEGSGRAELYVDRGHLHVFSCFATAEGEGSSLVDEFFARLSLRGEP